MGRDEGYRGDSENALVTRLRCGNVKHREESRNSRSSHRRNDGRENR